MSLVEQYKERRRIAQERAEYDEGQVLKRKGDRSMWLILRVVPDDSEPHYAYEVTVVTKSGNVSAGWTVFKPLDHDLRLFGTWDSANKKVDTV